MAHERTQDHDRSTLPEVDPGTEFELFFEAEFERLFGAIYVATGSRPLAARLTHLGFLRTWDRWARVREMERPSSFPIRVALSPLRMRLRTTMSSVGERLRGERRLEPFEDIEIDDRIRRALAAMPWRRRGAFALTVSLDLTPGEAGRALGMRAQRVRSEVEAATRLLDDPSVQDESPTAVDAIDRVRVAAAPPQGAFVRHLSLRRRARDRRRIAAAVVTVSLMVLIGVLAARGRGSVDTAEPTATPPRVTSLQAGTYRLPFLSTDASVTLPGGWRAGDSIWGTEGRGFAGVSTGPDGGSVSVAVFDLANLNPVDPLGHVYTQSPARLREWYDGFIDEFERDVRPRLRSSIAGGQRRWDPARPLPWILTQVPDGPIHVSEPIIAGRLGTMASFVNTGPSSALFGITDVGTISLRPDVHYRFWVPNDQEAFESPIMVGMAREPGALPINGEWSVVGSLTVGG